MILHVDGRFKEDFNGYSKLNLYCDHITLEPQNDDYVPIQLFQTTCHDYYTLIFKRQRNDVPHVSTNWYGVNCDVFDMHNFDANGFEKLLHNGRYRITDISIKDRRNLSIGANIDVLGVTIVHKNDIIDLLRKGRQFPIKTTVKEFAA